MKKLLYVLLGLLPIALSAQTTSENYVVSKVYKKATTTPVTGFDKDKISTTVQYFDGLGRVKQSIAVQAGGILSNANEFPIDWTLNNTGSTDFYNKNGVETENKIISGTTPFGDTDLLWQCTPDATSNADGGWNSDKIDMDNTKTYRYSVWVKRTGSQNGSTYHGVRDNISNLSGSANTNPYFWSGDLPQLNTWYLMVGIVHPYNYAGPDTGVSGVYDINGNRVIDGKEYKWSANSSSKSYFRSYLYYTTNTSVRQYFWSPLVQQVNGGEQTIDELAQSESVISSQAQPKDIVTHIEYDAFGRQVKEYLPYARATNNGGIITGNVATATKSYYQVKHADDFAGVNLPDINEYSEKEFDNSPLNRVLKQAAPGKDWKLGSNHEIKFDYQTNIAGEVKIFGVTTTFAENTYSPTLTGGTNTYLAGELYKTVTKDENHTGTNKTHTTEEFKNKQGQVILKRTYITNTTTADTFYVYDNFGNLTYVLPPKTDSQLAKPTTTELNELCYQYKYDQRNRLVEKKIPGKGWEYIIYDKLDRPVLTQDAKLKAQNKWLFTKYDAFGRITYTGYTYWSDSRANAQEIVLGDNQYNYTQYEKRASAQNYGTATIYYTKRAVPIDVGLVYTINYYDDYNVNLPLGLNNTITTSYGITSTTNTKGLATVNKTRVLNTNNWITTVTYYDEKARPIYIYSKNDELNTVDIVESKLDDFTGKVLETKATHKKEGKADIVTIDRFEYDHMDRLISQTQKINNQSEETVAENTYDELGQLKSKKVGGTLQKVDYKYNVRGWLKNINEDGIDDNDLFNFTINYNAPQNGATPLFNGNISETSWNSLSTNTSGNPVSNRYVYSYDALNRITVAAGVASSNYHVGGISYDKNGNILELIRNGHINAAATSFGRMDHLSYTYNSGNKLTKVIDNGNKTYGFKDGANATIEYTYDANGNMTVDKNKKITNITYNHLNLPTQVTINGKKIDYTYDAAGMKLSKTVEGVTTQYAGGYIYENDVLQFFNHPEGYVKNDNGTFNYVYQYKDHLGNVRLSYADNDGNGVIDASTEIIEESNYYPFGLKHKGYNNNISSIGNSLAQKWGYNGKEYQDDNVGGNNLNWHDFGARNYDAALGRWMNLDPLAEQMRRHSPYNYAFNNPVFFVDPDGMAPVYNWGAKRYENEKGDEVSWDIVKQGLGTGKGTPPGGYFSKMIKNLKNSIAHFLGFDFKSAEQGVEDALASGDEGAINEAMDYQDESSANLKESANTAKNFAELLSTFEPTGISGVYYEYTLGNSKTDKALAVLAIIPFTKLAKGGKIVKFIQAGKKVEAVVPSGFRALKQRSHGQKVYSNGKLFISPDIDGHNGGMWKAAKSLNNLRSKKTRLGTFDSSFIKIGD